MLPSLPFGLVDSGGYLLPGLAAGKSGEDLEPPASTLWVCGMPRAISWIMEFPLCFLGEIKRKNGVANLSRCRMTHCLAQASPRVPHQGTSPEAQHCALCCGALRCWGQPRLPQTHPSFVPLASPGGFVLPAR